MSLAPDGGERLGKGRHEQTRTQRPQSDSAGRYGGRSGRGRLDVGRWPDWSAATRRCAVDADLPSHKYCRHSDPDVGRPVVVNRFSAQAGFARRPGDLPGVRRRTLSGLATVSTLRDPDHECAVLESREVCIHVRVVTASW